MSGFSLGVPLLGALFYSQITMNVCSTHMICVKKSLD